jgi:glycosyltransferase involved in cell wall biosynthesis
VTAVVCVYNAGSYFRPSLQSLLDQTYAPLEILVIDDGSTDGCIEECEDLLSDPRVRLLRQENSGKPTALNRALQELRGEYAMIHDADDLSDSRRAEKLVACFLEDPDLAVVFSGHELILGDRRMAPTFESRSPEACRRYVEAFRMPAHDPTAMYRVSKIRGIEYLPDLRLGEGLDFILRVGERHPIRVLGECLYSYRIHPESITKATDREVTDRYLRKVVERACERRGIAPPDPPASDSSGRLRNQDRDNNLAAHFMDSTVQLRKAGRRREALRTALACLRLHPFDPHYQKALVYALAPLNWVEKVRTRRNDSRFKRG